MPVSTGVARISLASASVPATRTNHVIVVRCRVTSGSGAFIRASLFEGATDRTGVLEVAISTTLTTYQIPISDAVAATIASYSDLELRLWGYQPTGTGLVYQIAAVSLSLPAAGSATSWNGQALRPMNFNAQTNGTVVGSTNMTGVARISLEAVADPGVDSGHVIWVRARAYSGTGYIGAALYQGATNRSGDLATPTLTTTLTDYQLTIPDASAAAITDYSNLELRLWGVGTAAAGGTYGGGTYGGGSYGPIGGGVGFDIAAAYLTLSSTAGGSAPRLGLVTETSSGFSIATAQGLPPIYPNTGLYPTDQIYPGLVDVDQAEETSSAFSVAVSGQAAAVAVGMPEDTSAALALVPPIYIEVLDIATETSSAFAVAFLGGSSVIVAGIAIETNVTGRTTGSGDLVTRSIIKDGETDLVIGAAMNDNVALTYSSYFRGVLDEVAMLGGAISDREVKDLWARINHNGSDGAGYNSSAGIWAAATNYLPNGGFEGGVAGWGSSGAPATAETTEVLFGEGALRYSGATGTGVSHSGPVPVSNSYTASVWMKGSGVVKLWLQEYAAPSTLVGTTQSASFSLEGSWTRYSVTRTFGGTGNLAALAVVVQSATAVVYLDGAQVEQGVLATPYIETNGAIATRGAARVQVPAGYLDTSQGWVAARIRVGWAGASAPSASPRVFSWYDNASNRLECFYDKAGLRFSMQRVGAGVSAGALVSKTVTAAERVTVIAAWTGDAVKLSLNGGAFTSTASASIPALTATMFDVGSWQGTVDHLDGDFLWFSCGVGTLTDADARTLYDWNDEPPRMHSYPAASLLRFSWDAVDDYGLEAGYTHPISTGKLRRIFHKPGAKRGATELELIDDMERLQTEQGVLEPVVTGEYMGEAISRILKKIGMADPSMWDLDDGEPGLTRVQNDGSQTWLSLLVDIVTSDFGIFLIDAEGRAVFRERRSRPLAPYRGRLSRELHALEPGVDLDRIVNTWAVSADDQPEEFDESPTEVATFQRSYRRYGIRFSSRGAKHLSTREQAYSLAEHLVRRSAEPDAPVYAVSLTNRSDRQLALALGLQIGDMIEVFGKKTIGHYIVEQVEAEISTSEGKHDVALIVSAL